MKTKKQKREEVLTKLESQLKEEEAKRQNYERVTGFPSFLSNDEIRLRVEIRNLKAKLNQ